MFEGSGTIMKKQRLLLSIKKLQQSHSFSNSPVSYISDLLKQYINGDISRIVLTSQYKSQTVDAQLYFRHMPEAMRKENQQIFKKEFKFADAISKLLLKSQVSDDALLEQLQQCLEDYLRE